jgi:hypothetical protein
VGEEIQWPPAEADVREILDNLSQAGGPESPEDLKMAVLGMMAVADRPLSVREILKKLGEDYDAPPRRATIMSAYAKALAEKN